MCLAVRCGGAAAAVLLAWCMLLRGRAGRGEEGGARRGVAIVAGAARNLSHYLFLWISRAPAPAILRARPPASSELETVAGVLLFVCWIGLFIKQTR